MKICQKAYKICLIGFKLLPNTKLSVENCQITFNTSPKWRNFAKSGHTANLQKSCETWRLTLQSIGKMTQADDRSMFEDLKNWIISRLVPTSFKTTSKNILTSSKLSSSSSSRCKFDVGRNFFYFIKIRSNLFSIAADFDKKIVFNFWCFIQKRPAVDMPGSAVTTFVCLHQRGLFSCPYTRELLIVTPVPYSRFCFVKCLPKPRTKF